MGKFRTKIKGKNKGKKWQKGQSSTSNPKTQKYREMAKSRFFQENLGNTGLTELAVNKHNAMITYGHSKNKQKPRAEYDLSIAKDFENMSVRTEEGEDDSEYSGSMKSGTFKTFQTFASDWSQCSNISFSKLLTRFDTNNLLHKEMLAVLAAVTEVIKEQGGKETSTEYYAALMETLRASTEPAAGEEGAAEGAEGAAGGQGATGAAAVLSLLGMGLRAVPAAVLRRRFAGDAALLGAALARPGAGCAERRAALGALSVLLRAQDRAAWGDSSTVRVFETVLAFMLHAQPKVRKAAHHAVAAVLRGSCFMTPAEGEPPRPQTHPGAAAAAAACGAQLAPAAPQRATLHTLALLRDVLPLFSKDHMKSTCEAILSLMTHNNIYMKTSCLHTLHALFSSVPGAPGPDAPDTGAAPATLVPAGLVAQLTRALLAARPGAKDTAQLLAWTAVMEQAYSCLARLDLERCLPAAPAFARVCTAELWASGEPRAAAAATGALKVILHDCVRPALADEARLERHRAPVQAVLAAVGAALRSPFTHAAAHVVTTIATCFEIATPLAAPLLSPLLVELVARAESPAWGLQREAAAAAGAAARALGPRFVLDAAPLRAGPDALRLDRAWLLPVLRERVAGATLQYFAAEILELAALCRRRAAAAAAPAEAHSYELLCSQLWSLFPSFCNRPTDIKDSFKSIARVLGAVLKDSPELRAPVLQGLRRLAAAPEPADRAEVGRFAKNFLPILLNIYMTPAAGARAQGQRLAALETIQVYLTISDQSLHEELWRAAMAQLGAGAGAGADAGAAAGAEGAGAAAAARARREAVLDAVRVLALHQPRAHLTQLLDDWLIPLFNTELEPPKKAKKMKRSESPAEPPEAPQPPEPPGPRYKDLARALEAEHKKAFRVLEELLGGAGAECRGFVADNYKRLRRLLLSSLHQAANSSKAARLRCIEHLIGASPGLSGSSRLLRAAAAEAVAAARDINARVRQAAFQLIVAVGKALEGQEGGMESYQQLLLAGLAAEAPRLVAGALLAAAAGLFHHAAALGLGAAQAQLDAAADKMRDANREVVGAALSFVKVYTKVIPQEVLTGSLPVIFEALADMSDDCKRHARLEIGYFLTRMIRKFGADTVERLVPERDEITRRRLRNLRKLHARRQRTRGAAGDADDDAAGPGPGAGAGRGPQTLEEILADSDSDLEHVDEPARRGRGAGGAGGRGAGGGGGAWIQDDPENIVDLADVSAARKITGTDPRLAAAAAQRRAARRAGGLRTAPDGRLIIQDDSEDDERPAGGGGGGAGDEDDSSDDEAPKAASLQRAGAKRRYDDLLSLRSGRSARSAPAAAAAAPAPAAAAPAYHAGGRGIHRPLGAAGAAGAAAAGAAGAAGATGAARGVGADYRSKKAKGDIKKKGRPEPYAYLPLARASLNKRKKSVNTKQFSGIVKSKTKGFRNKGAKKK